NIEKLNKVYKDYVSLLEDVARAKAVKGMTNELTATAEKASIDLFSAQQELQRLKSDLEKESKKAYTKTFYDHQGSYTTKENTAEYYKIQNRINELTNKIIPDLKNAVSEANSALTDSQEYELMKVKELQTGIAFYNDMISRNIEKLGESVFKQTEYYEELVKKRDKLQKQLDIYIPGSNDSNDHSTFQGTIPDADKKNKTGESDADRRAKIGEEILKQEIENQKAL